MSIGRSIHIGLNSVDPAMYDGWSGDLVACEGDARDMARIATANGFTARLLLGRAATSQVVLEELENEARNLRAKDMLLVTYAGHGAQLPDQSRSTRRRAVPGPRCADEADMLDETWVLYDRMLLDDELYACWAKFVAGVRILVVSDSCHSGTVIREYHAGRGRVLPSEIAARVYASHRELYQGRRAKAREAVSASVLLLAACQDEQVALDGPENGLFTGTVKSTWDDGRFDGDYGKFYSRLVDRMPSTQVPGYYFVGTECEAFAAQRPFSVSESVGAQADSPSGDYSQKDNGGTMNTDDVLQAILQIAKENEARSARDVVSGGGGSDDAAEAREHAKMDAYARLWSVALVDGVEYVQLSEQGIELVRRDPRVANWLLMQAEAIRRDSQTSDLVERGVTWKSNYIKIFGKKILVGKEILLDHAEVVTITTTAGGVGIVCGALGAPGWVITAITLVVQVLGTIDRGRGVKLSMTPLSGWAPIPLPR